MANDGTLDLTLAATATNSASSISTGAPVPFWGVDPQAWDSVIIDGKTRLPGVAQISGQVKRRVEKKRAAGRHGTAVTYLGDEAAEFTISLKLWTQEHLSDFVAIIRSVSSKKPAEVAATSKANTKIKAPVLQVFHPVLAIYGVTQMHILEHSMPEPTDGGVYSVKLGCLEYLPPEKSQAKNVNTPTSGGKSGAGDLTKLRAVYNPKEPVVLKPSQTQAGPN